MGRHQEAIEHYKKALELSPKFTMSQRKIGTNLLFMGSHDEARAAYREAMNMETSPTDKITDMLHIARSYLYEGKPTESLAESEKALKMASEASLPERAAGIHSQRCDIYIEMGDLAKAEQSLAECKKVVMGSELSPAIKENFAKGALFDEALIAAKRKDFTKAMAKADEYKAKIEAGKDPKEMENHHELVGRIAFEKGDYAKVIEHLKQANQENSYTLYLLAVAESKAGDKAKAAELFKKVADWNEDSMNYAFVRSKAMMAVKKETPN
jgi:tetratricopeptide (TPR) repeat protein